MCPILVQPAHYRLPANLGFPYDLPRENTMSATQKHRLVAIGTALGDDAPLLKSCSISEQLSRLFQIELELRSDDPAIDFDKMVGSKAAIRVETPGGKTRYFSGFVSRFVQTGQAGGYAHYRATLVPW